MPSRDDATDRALGGRSAMGLRPRRRHAPGVRHHAHLFEGGLGDWDYGASPSWSTESGHSAWPEGHGTARSGPFAGRAPKGYRRSDEAIRDDVCDCLSEDSEIDASGVEVTVEGGEVTLAGVVADRDQKRWIEDLAEDVAGVADVHNRLRVGTRTVG